jgi:hypothetical protein
MVKEGQAGSNWEKVRAGDPGRVKCTIVVNNIIPLNVMKNTLEALQNTRTELLQRLRSHSKTR